MTLAIEGDPIWVAARSADLPYSVLAEDFRDRRSFVRCIDSSVSVDEDLFGPLDATPDRTRVCNSHGPRPPTRHVGLPLSAVDSTDVILE